jgi:hypothetical protein
LSCAISVKRWPSPSWSVAICHRVSPGWTVYVRVALACSGAERARLVRRLRGGMAGLGARVRGVRALAAAGDAATA